MINVLKKKLLIIKDNAKEIIKDSLSISDDIVMDNFSSESLDLIVLSGMLLTPENLIRGSNTERVLAGALLASPFIHFDKLSAQVILCGSLEVYRRKRLPFKQSVKLSVVSTLVAKGIMLHRDKRYERFDLDISEFEMPDIQLWEPKFELQSNKD